MGLIPFEYIGTECSGTVLRVGKGVTRVIPGDRVMCISPNCFMSKAYVWEGCCLKIPEALEGKSLVDIMASNVVFVTAIMGLMHVARMRKGEVSIPKYLGNTCLRKKSLFITSTNDTYESSPC